MIVSLLHNAHRNESLQWNYSKSKAGTFVFFLFLVEVTPLLYNKMPSVIPQVKPGSVGLPLWDREMVFDRTSTQ